MIYRLGDWLRHRRRLARLPVEAVNGRRGEDLAHRYLRRHGYTIVARNYRRASGAGEVDIVAWEGETLVFVEVKTRLTEEYGPPERAVDPEKEYFLRRAAADYARRAYVEWSRVRFDVVSVLLLDPPRVELIRDAFTSRRS